MKRATLGVLTAVLIMQLSGGMSLACDFCLLSQGISPLDTMKGAGIKVNERYTVLDKMYEGTSEIENPGAKETHWTTELTGFYSLTPEFMVMAVVPYKVGKTTGEADMTTTPPSRDSTMSGDASGLGDIAAMGRYTFLKRETPDTTTVMAGVAGVKFATGSTNAKTADGSAYLDSHLQPGTGSTDFLFGVSVSHSFSRFSTSANLLGTMTTQGKFGMTTHQFGNSLNYDVTAKYRVAPVAFSPMRPQWFAALGLNGEVRDREKEDGVTVGDSGGNTIYLSPGIQLVLAPHWAAELTYQYAIFHNLYGTQLGETYKSVAGITYLF